MAWHLMLQSCKKVRAVYVACSEHHREKSTSNKPSDSEENQKPALDLRAGGLAGVVKSVKSLVMNGAYIFSVVYDTLDMIVVDGFLLFGPKFFQQQFGLTATMAGISFGSSPRVLFCSVTFRSCELFLTIWLLWG